jgi:hypothetical protein
VAAIVPELVTGPITATAPAAGAYVAASSAITPVGPIAAVAPVARATITVAPDLTTEDYATAIDDVILDDLVWVELTPVPVPETIAPILRESYVMPALDAAHPAYQAHRDYPVITDVVGTHQIWVNNVNVTYWRGHPTLIRRYDAEAPFGDKGAVFELPQKDPWDVPGEGDLSWLTPDASVFIGIVDELGNIRRAWGPGFLDSEDNDFAQGISNVYEAKGDLWAALHQVHEPTAYMPPTDIGVFIPRLLNRLRGRRFAPIPEKITGRMTRRKGSRDQWVWQPVQDVLSIDGWTEDGRQWTLVQDDAGNYSMALKKAMTDITATCAYGTPLVEMNVRIDQSTRVDTVFARGIAAGGGGWANVKYPALELINPPPYPNNNAGDFLNLGDTDAGTSSGTGVSDYQRRVNELKSFGTNPVNGVMTSAWVTITRRVQTWLGIQVDGSVGPQTWNAVFDTAGNINLDPLRLPMATKPHSWPTLHSASGRVIGVNPLFPKGSFVPREIPLDLGTNVPKSEGLDIANTYLAIHGEPSATGSVTFIGDPNNIDRTRLNIGDNLAIPGYPRSPTDPTGDRVVQFSRKSVEMDGDADGRFYVVTFQIDERARDALTVDQLMERNRAALPDPARRPGTPNRSTRMVRDEGTPWDDESPCGVLRRTAVNGSSGLWSVITVPFAEVGQLAGVMLTCTRPFALAIFASLRITENKLASTVGNPFATSDPWRPHMDVLKGQYGLLASWGEQGNACGYSPGTESDGYGFTGRFEEESTLEYWTETAPYVSVALFMRGGSGFVEGDFLPAWQT